MDEESANLMARINEISQKIERETDELQRSELYNERGHLFDECDEQAKAIKDYLHALELLDATDSTRHSRIASVRASLGLTFMRLGQRESAVFWALGAVDRDRNSGLNLYDFGLICSHCELFHVAIEALKKALELNPGNQDARIVLGQCLHEVFNIKEAIEVLSKYVADYPHDFRGWWELGIATELQLDLDDRHQRALEYFHRALAENPPSYMRETIGRRIRGIEGVAT